MFPRYLRFNGFQHDFLTSAGILIKKAQIRTVVWIKSVRHSDGIPRIVEELIGSQQCVCHCLSVNTPGWRQSKTLLIIDELG